MFGTINYNSFYIFTGIMVGLIIISFVFFTIISIREISCYGSCLGFFVGVMFITFFTIVYTLTFPFFNNSWANQSKNNIKTAIRYNYNNAENISIEDDKGYFSVDDKDYYFEVIDKTLVIKDEGTVTKYISGDNY